MVAGLAILGALVLVLPVTATSERSVAGRVAALDDVRRTVRQLQDDVRQTHRVTPSATADSVATDVLELAVPTADAAGGVSLHAVRWDCSDARRCTRQDLTAGTSTSAAVDDLTASGVSPFVVVPSRGGGGLPSVRFRLSAPVQGRTAVGIDTTTAPRTCRALALDATGACPWP